MDLLNIVAKIKRKDQINHVIGFAQSLEVVITK